MSEDPKPLTPLAVPQPDKSAAEEAKLLKEWEVRHNAGVQFQSQFLTFGTIVTAAMTGGLGFALNMNDRSNAVFVLSAILCIAVSFTIGCVISVFAVRRYRRRVNGLSEKLFPPPAMDELWPLQIAYGIGAGAGVVFFLIISWAIYRADLSTPAGKPADQIGAPREWGRP